MIIVGNEKQKKGVNVLTSYLVMFARKCSGQPCVPRAAGGVGRAESCRQVSAHPRLQTGAARQPL